MTPDQKTGNASVSKSLETMFDLQRAYLEQNARLAEKAVELQGDSLESAANSVEAGRRMQDRTTQAATVGVGYYFDEVQRSLDELNGSVTDARNAFNKAFDDVEEVQKQAWAAFEDDVERSTRNYDEFTRNFVDTMNQSVEIAIENQREFERQAVEATMTLERTAEETVESVTEAVQDAADEGVRAVEDAAEESVRAVEEATGAEQ